MKQISKIKALNKAARHWVLFAILLTQLILPVSLLAQTDSAKTAKPDTEEESSMISPSIEFISVQKSDNTIDLKAAMKAKVKGTFYKLPLLKVSFVQVTDTEEKPLGFVITDKFGKAIFTAKGDSLVPDKEGKLHFKAVFAGNKQMDAAEEAITIKRARLEIIPVKEDSSLSVKVKLIDVGTGAEIPVKETVVGVFVHRLINPLKIGEGTTDENGEATVEVPANLPGDAKGNITLLAKLDENELYGNLEASSTQLWGISVSDKLSKMPRALWTSDPPIWMLVTFIILMTAVWGHYIVIIVQLFRLRKEEPLAAIPANKTNI
jgi:hypothetical protein